MALTIRNLSPKAENELKNIIETKNYISTKTKAIEYCLEERNRLLNKEKELQIVKEKYQDLKFEMEEIKAAIKLVINTK